MQCRRATDSFEGTSNRPLGPSSVTGLLPAEGQMQTPQAASALLPLSHSPLILQEETVNETWLLSRSTAGRFSPGRHQVSHRIAVNCTDASKQWLHIRLALNMMKCVTSWYPCTNDSAHSLVCNGSCSHFDVQHYHHTPAKLQERTSQENYVQLAHMLYTSSHW